MNEIQNVSRRRLMRQGLTAVTAVAIGSRIAQAVTTLDMRSLGASDCVASDTSYYDAYRFDPNGKPVVDNDDVAESNTNSRLIFTLTSRGTWTVIANTLKAGTSGDYAIALTSSACAATAPAGPRRRTVSHES
jgi:hypothetical protein